MRKFLIAVVAWCSLGAVPLSAQQQYLTYDIEALLKVAESVSERGFVMFSETSNVNPMTIFDDYKHVFRLPQGSEMRLLRTDIDPSGREHYRYLQHYQGIPLEGAMLLVHAQDGRAYCMNGLAFDGLGSLPTAPVLTAEQATQRAMAASGADVFMWQLDEEEAALREHTHNPRATYTPQPKLVFARLFRGGEQPRFELAWEMEIHTARPYHSVNRYFVDATNGSILNKVPVEMNCTATTHNTSFNGNRTIYTKMISATNYRLIDECTSTVITVRDANNNDNYASSAIYTDSDNIWTGNNKRSAGTSLFGLRNSVNMFTAYYARNGYDNAGGDVNIYHNWKFWDGPTAYYANASFNPNNGYCHVGNHDGNSNGSVTDDWNTVDIMSHELTHGVTHHMSGLVYQNQPGAANESFSDIFGEVAEFYVLGSVDWLVGGERGAIRNMANPNQYYDPDTYLGTYWYSGSGDDGGVHTNSGVMNYMFYLLTAGGSGTNDNGYSFSVSGIGILAAAWIMYHSQYYIGSNDDYPQVRDAVVAAAIAEYGACSNPAVQAAKAWLAVGVGPANVSADRNICGTLPNGTHHGVRSLRFSFTGCSSSAATTVTAKAGERVTFSPGFTETAVGSSLFRAELDPCSYTQM